MSESETEPWVSTAFCHSTEWLKGPKAKRQRDMRSLGYTRRHFTQVKFTLNLFFKDRTMLGIYKRLASRLLPFLYTIYALLQYTDNQIWFHAFGQSIRDHSSCGNPGDHVSSAIILVPGLSAVFPEWLMDRLQLDRKTFVSDLAKHLICKMIRQGSAVWKHQVWNAASADIQPCFHRVKLAHQLGQTSA